MGYETRFTGVITLDPPLSPAHAAYLRAFAGTRRVSRDERLVAERPDPIRLAVDIPPGHEGGWFVGAGGDLGQEPDAPDILDYNAPPSGQPHLWCCWEPTPDGAGLHVPEPGYHYAYERWLRFLINELLRPWGYEIGGEVAYQGAAPADRGTITATTQGCERRATGRAINGNGYGAFERGLRHKAMQEPEALEWLQLATEWSPEWPDARWEYGICLGMMDFPRQAFENLEQAIALEPDPARQAEMTGLLARIRASVVADDEDED